MRRRAALVAVGSVGVGLGACSGADLEEAARPSVTRADSAGIEVVTNHVALAELPAWSLDGPAVSIGSFDDAAQQLFQVTAARRLADGRIVVANSGSHELRFFDPGGAFLAAAGGKGEGPGEFQRLWALDQTAGDTLYAWDLRTFRVSRFTGQGEFLDDFRMGTAETGEFVRYLRRFADGSILTSANRTLGGEDLPQSGVMDSEIVYRLQKPDGTSGDTVDVLPGQKSWIELQVQDGEIAGISFWNLPLDPGSVTAYGARGFAYGPSESYEIRWYGMTGDLARIVRWDRDRTAVTPEIVSAMVTANTEGIEDAERRRTNEEVYAKLPVPERLPPYGGMHLDRAGRLWVQEFEIPGDDPATEWVVFDPAGAAIGRITLPARFSALAIGEDWILGRAVDELDIEYVRMFGLSRPVVPTGAGPDASGF